MCVVGRGDIGLLELVCEEIVVVWMLMGGQWIQDLQVMFELQLGRFPSISFSD